MSAPAPRRREVSEILTREQVTDHWSHLRRLMRDGKPLHSSHSAERLHDSYLALLADHERVVRERNRLVAVLTNAANDVEFMLDMPDYLTDVTLPMMRRETLAAIATPQDQEETNA